MMIAHLVLSLALAVVAVAILVRGLRFRPSMPVWSLSVIFFLVIWASGVWVVPIGPTRLGISGLPFVLIGILLTVLVAALSRIGATRTRMRSSAKSSRGWTSSSGFDRGADRRDRGALPMTSSRPRPDGRALHRIIPLASSLVGALSPSSAAASGPSAEAWRKQP